jgi:chemotaxis signal transduction protein
MKIATHDAAKSRVAQRSEAMILFAVADQTFAIAADAVQEVRSTDSLAGAANEINQQEVPKVRHTIKRGRRTYFVVSACEHFGLRVTRPLLLLILRQMRVAVLIDKIERMTEIAAVHALPLGFSGLERNWYRGLVYIDDQVIPVINASGFLTPEEFLKLDRAEKQIASQSEMAGAVQA